MKEDASLEWQEKQTEWIERHTAKYISSDREQEAREKRYAEKYRRFLLDFCRLEGRVLDIGSGGMVPILRRQGLEMVHQTPFRYHGIDPEVRFYSRDFPFAQAAGEGLPFKSGSFDTVMIVGALDHTLSPHQVIAEAARVLRSGGRFYISTAILKPVNIGYWIMRKAKAAGRLLAHGEFRTVAAKTVTKIKNPDLHDRHGHGHLNPMDRTRLLQAVSDAGLNFVREKIGHDAADHYRLFVETVKP
jgi:SAM-dependent methyltransferase